MVKYYLYDTLSINSIFHFVFPFIMGFYLEKKWKLGILVLIVFEILEAMSGLSPEPIINTMADLIIGTIGLYVGQKIKCLLW